MISNQILQTTLDGLKGITRIDLCICDTEGKVLASTFNDAEESESSILAFVDSPADSQVIQGFQFFKVFDEHQLEYILLARGASDDVYMVSWPLSRFRIFWWPIRNGLIRTILSKICFWTICCWWISTIEQRSSM